MTARALVRAALGHGDERVGGGDDARGDRNLVAGQAVGVARAVEVLVMTADDLRRVSETRDDADQRLAGDGVMADAVARLLSSGPR